MMGLFKKNKKSSDCCTVQFEEIKEDQNKEQDSKSNSKERSKTKERNKCCK